MPTIPATPVDQPSDDDRPTPPARSHEPWTYDEDQYLTEHREAPAAEVAAHLGRSLAAVHQRRARHRLERRT